MPLLPNLKQRIYVAELMDDPQCDPKKLLRSYKQLTFINWSISRMRTLLSRHILADIKPNQAAVHVVEVGCGGGDMLVWLAAQARRRGLNIEVTGVDTDPQALGLARERLCNVPNATVVQLSLQRLHELPVPIDYVFCNHVLHHIPPNDVVEALTRMRTVTRKKLLINDLQRSYFSYLSYTVLAGLLFHRSFTFHDGRLSIRKGFSRSELERLASAAGYPSETVAGVAFPGRVYLVAPGVEPLKDVILPVAQTGDDAPERFNRGALA